GAFLEQGLADRQGQIPQLVVGRGDRNRQNLRFLRPFEGLVTAAAVFQQGVGDQMGQGAELQIPLVAASALSRPEIFQPGIVHREVQQSPHRVGQGELLQHRCRKNVAVHNSKDSWVNSKRCQIGTYDTDFVSAEKRQHPELTGPGRWSPAARCRADRGGRGSWWYGRCGAAAPRWSQRQPVAWWF